MAKKTVKKLNFLKKMFSGLQVLPWYWKIVISVFLIFVGTSSGMAVLTSSSDLEMYGGYFILALLLWILIQIWLPKKEN